MPLKEDTMDKYERMEKVLYRLMDFNNLKNDLDSYLWDLIEFGIGDRRDEPNPLDYGLEKIHMLDED